MSNPKDYNATDEEIKALIKQVQQDEKDRAERGTGQESVE